MILKRKTSPKHYCINTADKIPDQIKEGNNSLMLTDNEDQVLHQETNNSVNDTTNYTQQEKRSLAIDFPPRVKHVF